MYVEGKDEIENLGFSDVIIGIKYRPKEPKYSKDAHYCRLSIIFDSTRNSNFGPCPRGRHSWLSDVQIWGGCTKSGRGWVLGYGEYGMRFWLGAG